MHYSVVNRSIVCWSAFVSAVAMEKVLLVAWGAETTTYDRTGSKGHQFMPGFLKRILANKFAFIFLWCSRRVVICNPPWTKQPLAKSMTIDWPWPLWSSYFSCLFCYSARPLPRFALWCHVYFAEANIPMRHTWHTTCAASGQIQWGVVTWQRSLELWPSDVTKGDHDCDYDNEKW